MANKNAGASTAFVGAVSRKAIRVPSVGLVGLIADRDEAALRSDANVDR